MCLIAVELLVKGSPRDVLPPSAAAVCILAVLVKLEAQETS